MKLMIELNAAESHALASMMNFFGQHFVENYEFSNDYYIARRLEDIVGTYKAELSTPAEYLPKLEYLITWQYGAVFASLANAAKSLLSAFKVLTNNLPKDFEKVARQYADKCEVKESETKASPWTATDIKTEKVSNEEYYVKYSA